MTENKLAKIIVDTVFKIHNQYGPGLFESVYEELMSYELAKQHLALKRQSPIPLVHELIKLEAGFRAALIADDKVLNEIKSVENLTR
jgi:GxxExxY protein